MFQKNCDVVARLTSERNIANVLVTEIVRDARGLVISPMPLGRKFGEKNIVTALKPVIALVGAVDGTSSAAETFSVSKNTVRRAMEENEDKLERELEPVRALAISRLSSAITKIDDEKLQDVGALNLSNIARNLSSVVGNLKKKDSSEGGNKFQFNIFTPGLSGMKDYEVLDVGN